jgi:hypothetical protein
MNKATKIIEPQEQIKAEHATFQLLESNPIVATEC